LIIDGGKVREPRSAAVLRHLPAVLFFLLIALVWTFPLVLHLGTHLPGPVVGDNTLSLWNFWWMRTARATGADFFQTPYLFAPVGEDLTLYTHTALPAYVGATILRGVPLVAALNLATLAALVLNGFLAYLLAWRLLRNRGAALVAGLVFAGSPYLSAHLNGHFDLTGIWTIPLFALVLLQALEGSIMWAIVAGGVLAATAYVAYYYVVYEAALVAVIVVVRAWRFSVEPPRRTRSPWLMRIVVAALVVDVIILAVIVVTGGFDVYVGPIRIRAPDAFNQLQAFWLLLLVALGLMVNRRIVAAANPSWSWRRQATAFATMGIAFAIVAEPLIWRGVRLIAAGQYVSQTYYWRSSPVGIDLLTLVLGNPFHAGFGSAIQDVYQRLGIDVVESGAWLGVGVIVFVVFAIRRRSADVVVREWMIVAGVFFVWALGSHVHAAGQNLGFVAPAALIRWIPFAANARMPGRTMAVVYLALGIVAAAGVAEWERRLRYAFLAPLVAVAAILVDFVPAPFPLSEMRCPPLYDIMRTRPEPGSVAEMALFLGTGVGNTTE
jgi:hypothetical protein